MGKEGAENQGAEPQGTLLWLIILSTVYLPIVHVSTQCALKMNDLSVKCKFLFDNTALLYEKRNGVEGFQTPVTIGILRFNFHCFSSCIIKKTKKLRELVLVFDEYQ